MQLIITLDAVQGFSLPLQYNYMIQSMIYNNIDEELAYFLHSSGYQASNRRFRLFTFSRLMGDFVIDKQAERIEYKNATRLVIGSPSERFCMSFADILIKRKHIRLGSNVLPIRTIEAQEMLIDTQSIVVRTLSPIVVYSTMTRADGRKYTCYFQPGEPEYNRLITNNIRSKYASFYQETAVFDAIMAVPIGDMKLSVMNYKGTVVKGYSGRLHLTGHEDLLQMAMYAGLGSKNSQGFGCLDYVGRR